MAQQVLGRVLSEAVFTGATPFDASSIRHDPALGGGALIDLGCYPIHWLRAGLAAEPEVRRAEARLNPLGADLEIEADLEFPGGRRASVREHGSGCRSPRPSPSRGRAGRCTSTTSCSRRRGTGSRPRSMPPLAGSPGEETSDHQLAAVVDALASGEPLPTEGRDPVDNMRVIDAVYAAAGVARR